jgi:hypothetical protein
MNTDINVCTYTTAYTRADGVSPTLKGIKTINHYTYIHTHTCTYIYTHASNAYTRGCKLSPTLKDVKTKSSCIYIHTHAHTYTHMHTMLTHKLCTGSGSLRVAKRV